MDNERRNEVNPHRNTHILNILMIQLDYSNLHLVYFKYFLTDIGVCFFFGPLLYNLDCVISTRLLFSKPCLNLAILDADFTLSGKVFHNLTVEGKKKLL